MQPGQDAKINYDDREWKVSIVFDNYSSVGRMSRLRDRPKVGISVKCSWKQWETGDSGGKRVVNRDTGHHTALLCIESLLSFW